MQARATAAQSAHRVEEALASAISRARAAASAAAARQQADVASVDRFTAAAGAASVNVRTRRAHEAARPCAGEVSRACLCWLGTRARWEVVEGVGEPMQVWVQVRVGTGAGAVVVVKTYEGVYECRCSLASQAQATCVTALCDWRVANSSTGRAGA